MISVYTREGHVEEALRILDSPELGCDSAVAKSDWALVRAKVTLLEHQRRYLDVWDYCRGILAGAQLKLLTEGKRTDGIPSSGVYGDDWRIWEALIDAAERIDTKE